MVAKAAGVTQPYVFHFFENKEGLFKAVIDRAFSRIYDTFAEIQAPADQLLKRWGMHLNNHYSFGLERASSLVFFG